MAAKYEATLGSETCEKPRPAPELLGYAAAATSLPPESAIDRDIKRMARHVMARHGRAAARVARERIRELENAGDRGAAAIWKQIAEAIAVLERNGGQ